MFGLLSTVVALLALVAVTPVARSPEAQSFAPCVLTADEALVVQIVNEERTSRGLSALEIDPVLVQVARDHSLDMATRGYFDHLAPAPAPRTPLDRYSAALGRQPECVVGENIGQSDQPLMALIHERMMASESHRANITDVEYQRVGVGVYVLSDGRSWVTEVFSGGRPADATTSGG
ncbi:MAG: CAP domain-containing protein [Armatimonadota bacterium]